MKLCQADKELVNHAIDATEERLQQIMKVSEKTEDAAVLWMLFNCGLRHKDLRRLRSSQISFDIDQRTITVRVLVTKGIRTVKKRRTVCWNWRSSPSAKIIDLLQVQRSSPDWRPLAASVLSKVNGYLKKATTKKDPWFSTGRGLTTYSYRRNFMFWLFDNYYDDSYSHKDNMEYLITWSLHQDGDTLESFYRKWSPLEKRNATMKEKKKKARRT